MLNDPLVVTYDSVSVNLPKSSGFASDGSSRILARNKYAAPDREFEVFVEQSIAANNLARAEIKLRRTSPDPDGDPFTGSGLRLPNSVGLIFETNYYKYVSGTDIPLLRTALLNLVDSALQDRLIGGEA